MSPLVWRTVARGWQESTGYTRPGTFAVIDTTAFVDVDRRGFYGRWVLGVWHLSAAVVSGATRRGGNSTRLTILAGADSPAWAKRLARAYQDDPESLYSDLWEMLDGWDLPPTSVTRETIGTRLGFVTDPTDERPVP